MEPSSSTPRTGTAFPSKRPRSSPARNRRSLTASRSASTTRAVIREPGERVVHPLGLVAKRQTWYLIADTDAGLRTFRVSRVRAVVLTDQPVVRPAGFDLAETWQTVLSTSTSGGPRARWPRCDPGIVGTLHGVLGTRYRSARQGATVGSAWRSEATPLRSWQRELAGFADHVEVTAPETVRAQLAHLGTRLTARYGSP